MRKALLLLLLAIGLGAATTSGFVLAPNSNYVDEVHYDSSLRVIVFRVHAKILWWTVDEYYGLNVKDDTNINASIQNILGDKPSIVHLRKQ